MCIWKNKVTNHNLLHFIQISFRTSTKSTEKNIVSSNALKLFQLSNFTTGRRLFFTNDKVNCFIRNTPLPPSGKHDPAWYTYIHTAQTGGIHKIQKAKKTVDEAACDRLFDIFIPFSTISNSPIPRKIMALRHFPPYLPAWPPDRLQYRHPQSLVSRRSLLYLTYTKSG